MMAGGPGPGIRAGELRHRIVLERPERSRLASGQSVPGWASVVSVWASVEPKASNETPGEQREKQTTHVVQIRRQNRYGSSERIGQDWRIRWVDRGRPRVLNLTGSVTPQEAGGLVILYAIESDRPGQEGGA